MSGVALRKFPPSATKTFTRPSCIAEMVFTASRPSRSGGAKPNSSPSARRNAGLIFSQIPTVRSPCTLLCPRTGQRPAPRRPICPRRSAKSTMLCTLATPFSCWVIPIAQQQIIRSDSSAISAPSAICSRVQPLASTIASHDVASRSRTSASNPSVWWAMKSCASSLPPAARSAASISFMSPLKSATSPFTRTGRNRQAIAVPGPSSDSGSCGFLNRIIPVSGSGLTLTILQPLRAAFCSSVSMRGWQVPGFWPMTKMLSAWLKSSILTVDLPMPIVSVSPAPLDSWHMFEQSGRLLVPNCRTKRP